MLILTTLLGEVCVLSTRLSSFLKGIEIISLYNILPSFIKISQQLFEIMDIQTHTHRQTDKQTDRHIHADVNNTCPKSKILGQVKKKL